MIAMGMVLLVCLLIIWPIPRAQAISVQVSGMPDHVSPDEEATISVFIDPEEAGYVHIVDIEMVVSNPSKGIMASGSFYANGTLIDDGGFIISASLLEGAVLHGPEFDNTTGVMCSVTILFKSSDFQPSTDNELTVFVDRGVSLSRLRSESVIFDIQGQDTWLIVVMVVAAVELVFFFTLFYAAKKRVVVRKRELRRVVQERRLRKR